MRIEWEYEGKKYVITGEVGGKMFLNGYESDWCEWILNHINSSNQFLVQRVKERAKEELESLTLGQGTLRPTNDKKLYSQTPTPIWNSSVKFSEKNGTDIATWVSEGVEYVVKGGANLYYLNGYRCYCGYTIMKNLKSTVPGLVNRAKENAKAEYERLKYVYQNWEYEGQKYEIHEKEYNVLYLNHIRLRFDGEKILKWLHSGDEKEIEKAQKLAQKLCRMENQEIVDYNNDRLKIYELKEKSKRFLENFLVWSLGSAIIAGVLFLVYKLWWFFIYEPAFEGPFRSLYTGEEVLWDTITFLFLLFYFIVGVIYCCKR